MEYHITVVTNRGGRRINSALGTRVQLCGAAPTSEDATVADARKIVRDGWVNPRGYTRCENCFGQLLTMDFNRSRKVED